MVAWLCLLSMQYVLGFAMPLSSWVGQVFTIKHDSLGLEFFFTRTTGDCIICFVPHGHGLWRCGRFAEYSVEENCLWFACLNIAANLCFGSYCACCLYQYTSHLQTGERELVVESFGMLLSVE